MIAVSTLVSEDGVIGLNGKRYLLDDYGDLMLFDTKSSAKQFVIDNGGDLYNDIEYHDEYINYEEI